MSERRDPNTVSIQIKIPRQLGLLHSAFIGSALLMLVATAFTYRIYIIEMGGRGRPIRPPIMETVDNMRN